MGAANVAMYQNHTHTGIDQCSDNQNYDGDQDDGDDDDDHNGDAWLAVYDV